MATFQLNIPEEERRQFQSFLCLYSKGKVILQEGQEGDERIFLLRQGLVEVTKQVGHRQEMLSRIEAVNFFGEMALMSGHPRTATVTALSDPTVVYTFDKPNLHALLSNAKWGPMLVRRLAESLEHMNQQYEQAQLQIERVSKKGGQGQQQLEQLTLKNEELLFQNERLRTSIAGLLGLFLKLSEAATDDALRRLLVDAIPRLVPHLAKEFKADPLTPDNYDLADYWHRGLLTEPLFLAATKRK